MRDVAAGEADLAWVGTRAFDTLGVNSLPSVERPDADRQLPAAAGGDRQRHPRRHARRARRGRRRRHRRARRGHAQADRRRPAIAVTRRLRRDHVHVVSAPRPTPTPSAPSAPTPSVAIAATRNAGPANGEIHGFEMNLLGYSVTAAPVPGAVRDGQRQPVGRPGGADRQPRRPRRPHRHATRAG